MLKDKSESARIIKGECRKKNETCTTCPHLQQVYDSA